MSKIERHHILEIISTKDGTNGDYGTIIVNSKKRLKELGLYGDVRKENYGLPSWMICYCTRDVHTKLHYKFDSEWKGRISDSIKGEGNPFYGKKHSSKTKDVISETHKGKTKTVFGEKFKEHFGITKCENPKLYERERQFYKYNGHCRWENKESKKEVA